MGRLRTKACRLAAALAFLACAGGTLADNGPDPRRSALEQKLKLLESVINSPKARQAAAGDNAEAKNDIARARELMESARRSLAGGDLEQAGPALDQALRSVSSATSRGSGGANINLSAQRARNAELLEQARSYRASLMEAAADPAIAAPARAAVEKLDRSVSEADKLAVAGKYEEANRTLGEAYLAAVTALSTLRSGQTVTLTLKFDSAADEYAYEDKRNHSHEMMVDMMITEGKAEGPSRPMVERFLEEHRRLRAQAEKEAKGGNHKPAIKLMEQATGQLVRALQMLGVPVF